MSVSQVTENRLLFTAPGNGQGATRVKTTTVMRPKIIRDMPIDAVRHAGAGQLGYRLQQTKGVWMQRPAKQIFSFGNFDYIAGIHHIDAVVISRATPKEWVIMIRDIPFFSTRSLKSRCT